MKLLMIPKNNAANVTDMESIRMSVSIAFGSGSLKKLNFHLPWYDRKRQLEKEKFWCHWKNFKVTVKPNFGIDVSLQKKYF